MNVAKKGLFSGDWTTWTMLGLIIVIVIVMIFSSVKKRKQDKVEKERRQKEVKAQIKNFLRDNDSISHKRIEYDKVVARTGKEYKYRDVFDVVVKLYNSKTNKLETTKAFEVEGFTKQVHKKEYLTTWKVNSELDLKTTLENLKKQVKKSYWKMNKAEKKIAKLERREQKDLYKIQSKKEKLNKKLIKKPVPEKVEKKPVLIKKHPNEKFQGKSK